MGIISAVTSFDFSNVISENTEADKISKVNKTKYFLERIKDNFIP